MKKKGIIAFLLVFIAASSLCGVAAAYDKAPTYTCGVQSTQPLLDKTRGFTEVSGLGTEIVYAWAMPCVPYGTSTASPIHSSQPQDEGGSLTFPTVRFSPGSETATVNLLLPAVQQMLKRGIDGMAFRPEIEDEVIVSLFPGDVNKSNRAFDEADAIFGK